MIELTGDFDAVRRIFLFSEERGLGPGWARILFICVSQ